MALMLMRENGIEPMRAERRVRERQGQGVTVTLRIRLRAAQRWP